VPAPQTPLPVPTFETHTSKIGPATNYDWMKISVVQVVYTQSQSMYKTDCTQERPGRGKFKTPLYSSYKENTQKSKWEFLKKKNIFKIHVI